MMRAHWGYLKYGNRPYVPRYLFPVPFEPVSYAADSFD